MCSNSLTVYALCFYDSKYAQHLTDDLGLPPLNTPPGSLAAANLSNTRRNVRLAALGAICAAAFIPWATITAPFVGSISRNGIDGDGKYTLIAAGIALVLNLRQGSRPVDIGQHTPSAVAGVLCALAAFFNIQDLQRVAGDTNLALVQVGIGPWATLVASAVTFASSLGSESLGFGDARIEYASNGKSRRSRLKRQSESPTNPRLGLPGRRSKDPRPRTD